MFELTIAALGDSATTTGHRDADGAYRALISHAVREDLYVQGGRPTSARATTSFALVKLDEAQRGSRVVGTATISDAGDLG